jgi:hypothetical protein
VLSRTVHGLILGGYKGVLVGAGLFLGPQRGGVRGDVFSP